MEDLKCYNYECLLNRYGFCQCKSNNDGECDCAAAREETKDAAD